MLIEGNTYKAPSSCLTVAGWLKVAATVTSDCGHVGWILEKDRSTLHSDSCPHLSLSLP